jgi:hypothetical protein
MIFFEERMLLTHIQGGKISYNEFLLGLYENKSLSKRINEYVSNISKSTNKIKDV